MQSLETLLAVLTMQAGYNSTVVLLGVGLLGVAAGLVGTFAMLRKRSLMSDTLSHATLPGIAVAFLLATALGQSGRSLWALLAGAAASGILGVLTVQLIIRRTRLPVDAAMGAVLSVFFGLGFVLLSYIQALDRGDQGGVAKFIYGQTATMTVVEASAIGIVALLAAGGTAALLKEFRLVAFDPDFAQAQGWPVSVIDLLMMALVVAVTVVGLRAVGLILVVALLVVPPASARLWSERLVTVALLAALFGGFSGYVGAAVSALAPGLPAGAVIVLVAGALFLASLLFAPARGILAAGLRRFRLRLDIANQHVLRAIFECAERGDIRLDASIHLHRLRGLRAWPAAWLALVVSLLAWRGLLRRQPDGVALTPAGQAQALRITRNHRLWELFLVDCADLAPSHVDHSADLVEHVLSPELVARLENELAARGRLPRQLGVAPSVHPLAAAG